MDGMHKKKVLNRTYHNDWENTFEYHLSHHRTETAFQSASNITEMSWKCNINLKTNITELASVLISQNHCKSNQIVMSFGFKHIYLSSLSIGHTELREHYRICIGETLLFQL
jgi:hypothetical protein